MDLKTKIGLCFTAVILVCGLVAVICLVITDSSPANEPEGESVCPENPQAGTESAGDYAFAVPKDESTEKNDRQSGESENGNLVLLPEESREITVRIATDTSEYEEPEISYDSIVGNGDGSFETGIRVRPDECSVGEADESADFGAEKQPATDFRYKIENPFKEEGGTDVSETEGKIYEGDDRPGEGVHF